MFMSKIILLTHEFIHTGKLEDVKLIINVKFILQEIYTDGDDSQKIVKVKEKREKSYPFIVGH